MRLAMRRLVISVFLVAHLAAIVLTNMPANPLQEAFGAWVPYYLQPTGQWQSWGMFAPEPPSDTFVLKALVKDSHGLLHHYDFPTTIDKSPGESVWLYRHSKYANVVGLASGKANREFAARFVVRELDLKADDFPATVQLLYEVFPTRRVDAPADEPPAAPWPMVVETYGFPNLAETQP